MTLLDKIREDIKKATIEKQSVKKDILKVVVGETQRKSMDMRDDDVCKAIRKIIEGNKETLKFKTCPKLTEENAILESYLPTLWTHKEIEAFFLNSDNPEYELIQNAESFGKATGIAMKALKAANAPVDGKTVQEVVKAIIENQ